MRCLLCLLCVFLAGCDSSKEPLTHFDGQEMTMRYHVMIGKALSDREKDQVQHAIDDNFFRIHTLFNRFNPHSELSRLNALGPGEKVSVSDELYQLLKLTDRMVHLTEGRFDPTVWSVQQVWEKSLVKGELPHQELLEAKAVGWDKVHLDEKTFWKENSLTQLDLSGIAKGHGIDLLVEKLNRLGYDNVYVEWGGEIRVSGRHPEGRPWTVAITPLGDAQQVWDTVELDGQGVATSGDYLQYWQVGKETYTHIVNPVTKEPLKRAEGGVASVTVCAPTCAEADALATTAMIFSSVEEAQKWALRYPEYTFWFITREKLTLPQN